MEVDSEAVPVKVAPEGADEGSTVWGDFIIHGRDGTISLSKELFNGEGTIDFTTNSKENSEARGDWPTELLLVYKQLVELRRAMNFYFFIDGVMKDDVSEISVSLKEGGLDFLQLFYLCETLKDTSIAYYSTYYIEAPLQTSVDGTVMMPLVYLRHYNGQFYAEVIATMLDDDEGGFSFDEEIPLINAKKFDLEFYMKFCKLRTKLNGKLFENDYKILDIVKTFLDKYSYQTIGQAIKFGDFIGDSNKDGTKYTEMELHMMSDALGCYVASLVGTTEDFSTVEAVVTHVDKPATSLLRESGEGSGEAVKVSADAAVKA